MIRHLAQASIRHPVRVLAVAAILVLAASSGLPRLRLRTDGQALVPPASPEVLADREIRRKFGTRDLIAVVIGSDREGGIFNPDSLRRIEELTAALRRFDGVRPHDVTSLATERGFRRESGVLAFRRLLDPMPQTPEEMERLRSELHRIGLYRGTLVSFDGGAAAVLLGAPPAADRVGMMRAVERLAAQAGEAEARVSAAVVGAPVAEALLGRHVLADLKGLLPAALALMGLVFLLAFRRGAAALLPLAEIGVVLAAVFGLMGWLGVPVYLTTAVLPVILTAVGVADEIHVFRRYLDLGPSPRMNGADHRRLVGAVLDEMVPPIVATSTTTAVAFLSFALSPIAPVRTFGLFTALGVALSMVCSLAVVPALMVLLGPGRLVPDGAPLRPGGPFAPHFARLARGLSRRRRAVLAAAAVAAVVALDGVRRLEVQDSWTDGFDPDSAFARSTRDFDRRFLGTHRLLVAVEVEAPRLSGEVWAEDLGPYELRLAELAVPPGRLVGSWIRLFRLGGAPERQWSTWIEAARRHGGEVEIAMPRSGGSAAAWLHPRPSERLGYEIWSEPFLAPPTLARVGELETFLAAQPGVGGVLGPARYLDTVGFMLRPESPGRRLPVDPKQARTMWTGYGAVRGAERLRQVVDAEYRRALVAVVLQGADYAGTRRLLDAIRAFERDELSAHGIRLAFGGDVAVSQALIGAVVTTQVRSLLFSLAGVLALAALFSRSLTSGVVTVLPSAFAVLAVFAVMGWAGVPLGVATSMFAAMTLGPGVDYAIHFLARYRLAGAASALATAGTAILIDALAIGCGFGVLSFSGVPANARLGMLMVTSVAGCVAATFALLPTLLAMTKDIKV